MEPMPARQGQQYMVARALIDAHKTMGVCKVLNPSNAIVTLRRNLPLAKIEGVAALETDLAAPYEANTINEEAQFENGDSRPPRSVDDLGIKLDNTNLTPLQHEQLHHLINRNVDVFATSLSELPGTTLHYHEIDTGDAPPQRQRTYRHSPIAKKEVEKQTKEMLDSGIITPSNSMWSSPSILVKKKDGSFRFCIDYRKVNAVTKIISWPLPLLNDVLDAMSENQPTIFSVMDMKSGYFQIPLHPNSQPKTAFTTHEGSYEFTRIPFGLCNSGQAYQMLMNQVFRGMLWKSVVVYIDDILCFSKDFKSHLVQLQEVFDRLRSARLRLHPKKCQFAVPQVVYLGHVLSETGVAVDQSKVAAVKDWPVPKSVKDVRAFLGYCNYYRKFVKGFANIAAPLNNLLKKDQPFEWTQACQKSFEDLRVAMTTTPVLAYADMSQPFSLTTDASTTAIGYVLSQLDSQGREHPIAFGGRALRAAEKRWSATDIEGLALAEGIKEYHAFLSNKPFTVYTDHISLKWIQSTKNAHGRLYRWSLLFQPLRFTVIHKPGRINCNADSLSRRDYPPPPPEDPDDDITNDVLEFAQLQTPPADSDKGEQTPQEQEALAEPKCSLENVAAPIWP